jgi:nucleotide-binding universal stress UspA family protein
MEPKASPTLHDNHGSETMIPPTRILAALDFSAGARAALSVAIRLANQCSAELHLLYAVDPALGAAAGAVRLDLDAEILDEMKKVVTATGLEASGTPRFHVVAGDAAQVILDIAARERADVIVLGTHGHTVATWPGLGTTVEQVLRRSMISVLAVPADWPAAPRVGNDLLGLGPVLVGLDMTCPAIAAATAACQLAAVLKTHVTLVHAVPPPQVPSRWQRLAVDAAERHYAETSADYARVSRAIQAASPVRTIFSVGHGAVLDVLTETCAADSHAFVVLGRGTLPHAYGPPGSVVARLLTVARVPVLMHVSA